MAEQYAADFADELTRKPCDVDCGSAGHVGRSVADHGARVIGVDLSVRSVALAQRLHPALRFVAADMRALPFATGSCAGIVAFCWPIYTTDPYLVLVELRRVLGPGGALSIAVHAGEGAQRFDSYKGIPMDVELQLRSPEVLAGQLGTAGFTVDRVDVRPPYPFEHATRRLDIGARVAWAPDQPSAEACSPTG